VPKIKTTHIITAIFILALGIAIHIGMVKDRETLCSRDDTAFKGC
jgi:hypothetical protein